MPAKTGEHTNDKDDVNKSLMIGDSENDADAAKLAGIPMILLENG